MSKPGYTGWYDGSPTSAGNVTLCYFNHVVNTYPSIGQDANDPRRYTASHYIEAIGRMIEAHRSIRKDRRFIIDLPLKQVWRDENGMPVMIDDSFIERIVQAFDDNLHIVGWYAADEPELWGHVNNWPKLDHKILGRRYDAIKRHSDIPVICVFCDHKRTFDLLFDAHVAGRRIFDIFGFDYYPYRTDRDLPVQGSTCRRSFLDKMTQLGITYGARQILYVGQASGTADFETREPELEEMADLYEEWTKVISDRVCFGFLLWSWSYASSVQRERGNFLLDPKILNQHTLEHQPWRPPSRWRRLLCRIFNL